MVRVKSDFLEEQLAQLVKELKLDIDRKALFKNCIICNMPLEDAAKESVKAKVPAYVLKTQEAFRRCTGCGKIYWQGTHWELANKFLDDRGI
jgi:uncharacterized protein with PIN domain